MREDMSSSHRLLSKPRDHNTDGCGSKLSSRGKPQVLVFGKPFTDRALAISHLAPQPYSFQPTEGSRKRSPTLEMLCQPELEMILFSSHAQMYMAVVVKTGAILPTHFRPPILVVGLVDVHWGYRILTHGHIRFQRKPSN